MQLASPPPGAQNIEAIRYLQCARSNAAIQHAQIMSLHYRGALTTLKKQERLISKQFIMFSKRTSLDLKFAFPVFYMHLAQGRGVQVVGSHDLFL